MDFEPMPDGSRPLLSWRRTWSVGPLGVEECATRTRRFQRLSVYRIVGGPRHGRWRWCVTRDFVQIAEGYATVRSEAALAAERSVGIGVDPARPSA